MLLKKNISLVSVGQFSSLDSEDDDALFGPGSSVKAVTAAQGQDMQKSPQHVQTKIHPSKVSEPVVELSPVVTLGSSDELKQQLSTSENDAQEREDPVENFGFDGNDSDGGFSVPSDENSVGVGGLSDDEFEVTFANIRQHSDSTCRCPVLRLTELQRSPHLQTSHTPSGFGFDRNQTDSDDEW